MQWTVLGTYSLSVSQLIFNISIKGFIGVQLRAKLAVRLFMSLPITQLDTPWVASLNYPIMRRARDRSLQRYDTHEELEALSLDSSYGRPGLSTIAHPSLPG